MRQQLSSLAIAEFNEVMYSLGFTNEDDQRPFWHQIFGIGEPTPTDFKLWGVWDNNIIYYLALPCMKKWDKICNVVKEIEDKYAVNFELRVDNKERLYQGDGGW